MRHDELYHDLLIYTIAQVTWVGVTTVTSYVNRKCLFWVIIVARFRYFITLILFTYFGNLMR